MLSTIGNIVPYKTKVLTLLSSYDHPPFGSDNSGSLFKGMHMELSKKETSTNSILEDKYSLIYDNSLVVDMAE